MSLYDEHDTLDAPEDPRALPPTYPIPHTHGALWLDRGLERLLEGALRAAEDPLSDQGVTAPLYGIHVTGVGASAALWRTLDWARERELEATPITPAGAPWAGEVISALTARPPSHRPRLALLDDLHRADRPCLIALAATPLEARAPTLIVWSGEPSGPAAALWGTLPPTRRWRLTLTPWGEGEWGEWEGRAGGLRPLGARDPHLSPADQLRAAELAYESGLGAGEVLGGVRFSQRVDPTAAAAAALGPVVPERALGAALGLSEEALAFALREAHLKRVGYCLRGGGLWRADVPARWVDALREAHALPPTTLSALARALDDLYPPQDRWRVTSAATRLHQLQHQTPLPPLTFSEPTPETLWADMERLSSALTEQAPPGEVQGALAALCGLALEWAQRGPGWGRWAEAQRALRLGVAAAERLRDPLRGARLLLSLGALLVSEGLGAQAVEPLEAAAHLMVALKRPEEASRAALLCAEAELLAARPRAALARLEAAERVARDLDIPATALHARYKAGLIWLQLGDPARAEAVFARLPSEGVGGELGEALALARASVTLAALSATLSASDTALGARALDPRLRAARALIAARAPSPTRDALAARAAWLALDGSPLAALLEAQRSARSGRDVGAWLSGQVALADCVLEALCDPTHSALPTLTGGLNPAELTLQAREGVELAIKVASGARDSLRLCALYARLSALYAHAGAAQAAAAALAFAEVWADRFDLSPVLPAPHPVAVEALALEGGVRAQASGEVEALISVWTETPLSGSLSAV